MTLEFLKALAMIFMAEMGDKTQIIAMGLAIKYPIRKILIGIALGVFVNHGLAILLGSMLSRVMPIEWLQVAAGALFIFFAFGSLSIEDEEVEEEKTQYGVIFAVALSFFLGEMGDKTQLTALGLGSTSSYPFLVLLGTTVGMILTSLIGILIGIKLGKSIDPAKLKIGAFAVFSIFGLEKLFSYLFLPYGFQMVFYGALLLYIIVSILLIKRFISDVKTMQETQYQRRAQALFDLKQEINTVALNLCQSCDTCDGKSCLVGYMKWVLESDGVISKKEERLLGDLLNKSFDKEEARDLLINIVAYDKKQPDEYTSNEFLIKVRNILEQIIFNQVLNVESFEEYESLIQEDDIN